MNDPIHDLRRFAHDLESEVPTLRAEVRARRAIEAVRHAPRRPRRTIIAITTTVLMGVGNAAMAAVADPAVPGDTLYGLDRAYEQVGDVFGIGGTHVAERFDEAGELVERGRAADALQLVQETLQRILDSDDPQAAVDELVDAAGPDAAQRVQALLTYIHSNGSGSVDGQKVAEYARMLVDEVELPEQAQGNPGGSPDDVPPGPPASTPGNPDPGRGRP
jgi:hypothetical protein